MSATSASRDLSSAERYCRELTGDTPEGRRICADPNTQRCLRFFSGEEPTLDNLLACYGADPNPDPSAGPRRIGRS